MKTIKEAADALLSKKEITQEEYDVLEKNGAFKLTKEASFGSFLTGPLRNALLGTALLGLAGGSIKELVVDPIKSNIDTKRSFDLMTKKVPALAEKNKTQMQDYFDVVKTFSPKAASNPLVAGALVNKMMEFGGVDHKLVQDITAIEEGVSKPSLFGTTVESAAKSMGTFPKGD